MKHLAEIKDIIKPKIENRKLSDELKKELGAIKSFSKGEFIFSDSPNTPIDPNNFRKRMWRKDLEETGLLYIRIHADIPLRVCS